MYSWKWSVQTWAFFVGLAGSATWAADACNLAVVQPLVVRLVASLPSLPENLALGKLVTASRSDQPPELAVDGSGETYWLALDYPPQWIEVDLGATHTIRKIRLHVAQLPDGDTVHSRP